MVRVLTPGVLPVLSIAISDYNDGLRSAESLYPLDPNWPSAAPGLSEYRAKVMSLGPVGYWRLGEASGTSAVDETGARTGTYVGGPALGVAGLLTGDANTAMSIDAATKYCRVSTSRILSGLSQASLVVWASTPTLVGIDATLYCERGAAGNDIWKLEMMATNGRPRFVLRNDAGSLQYIVAPSGTYANNGRHMFGLTKSGTAVVLYADGASLGTFTQTVTDTFTGTVSTRLGSDEQDSAGAFRGTIDEPAIWTRALSPAEMADVYAAGT